MALTFYYGSGSPFAWKVWLALEYKNVPYELKRLHFDKGDLATPEFQAVNPRRQVPAITVGDFSLWESGAIVEYLEEAYPDPPLLPSGARARAVARRIDLELNNHLFPAVQGLMRQTIFRRGEEIAADVQRAKEAVIAELDHLEREIVGDYFAGPLTLADFTAYPQIRLLGRIAQRFPQHDVTGRIGPRLAAWQDLIEALPFVEKTSPPHWKDA